MSSLYKTIPNKSYFAAANGYTGFRSDFDLIFNRKELTKLYVIKGGPGTGKSTLMRKVVDYATKTGIYCEGIFCSSDPNSYDGVILRDGDKSIAIADGTAPHVIEPKYPGAVEEIINLGVGFNTNNLVECRNEIIKLADKKAQHYQKASCSNAKILLQDKSEKKPTI